MELKYIVPVVSFFVSLGLLYLTDPKEPKEKKKPFRLLTRIILPSIVIALLVFVIIKHKDSLFSSTNEPLMEGEFFD
jgi:hypothetical protein